MNPILDAGLTEAGILGSGTINPEPGESGTLDRIGDGLYTVTLPSGRTVIVDGNGDIVG